MNIHFDMDLIQSVDAVIEKYNSGEFASPSRSTVPLLSWLKHEQDVFGELLQDLGMPQSCTLHLEYKVAPPKGKGKPSHTDIMIKSGDFALAIEAKWTEPRYETVGEWKVKGLDRQNRNDVLTGWLDLLQRHSQRTLHVEDFNDVVYQMLHRAASACATGNCKPKMAYLLFKPSPDTRTADTNTIRTDLDHLWRLLNCPPSFPFYLIEVNMTVTTAFKVIASLQKANEDTTRQVCATLRGSERLFNFEKYCVKRVGENS